MMKKIHLNLLAATVATVAALSSASPASAATACYGQVTRVGVDAKGIVNAHIAGDGVWLGSVMLCSLTGTYGWAGIVPDACKDMLSMLTAAQLSGQQVGIFFNKAGAKDQTLCTVPNGWWNVANDTKYAFYYMELKKAD